MQRQVLYAALALVVLLGLALPSEAARRRRAPTLDPVFPAQCLKPIPGGEPDPFIPAATMVDEGGFIRLRSCFMISKSRIPAGGSLHTVSSFMLFAPDATGRPARFMINEGQSTGDLATVTLSGAPGVRVIPISADISDKAAGLEQVPSRDLLVGVAYGFAPTITTATISTIVHAAAPR